MRKAVFLDRDGVLTIPEFRDGRSYAPRNLDRFSVYPDAPQAVADLRRHGFLTIVVTNQPDVGNGLTRPEVLDAMHTRLRSLVPVDSIEQCTHAQEDDCDCRKPRPGMFLRAAQKLGIDLSASYMIGDRKSDVDAARGIGCRCVFIDLGYSAEAPPGRVDAAVHGIQEAVRWILEQERALGSATDPRVG